jgi:hypothetical protein
MFRLWGLGARDALTAFTDMARGTPGRDDALSPAQGRVERANAEGHTMTTAIRRVHYFSGQLLTPEDLQAEQDYHREMRYRHNRLLGYGVVDGLDVTVGDGSTVVVSPGFAIDRRGRELVLPDHVTVDVCGDGTTDRDGSRDLIATWEQEPEAFVVATGEGTDEAAFTRWLERPQLALVPAGESPAGSVVLGRVVLSDGDVSGVDVSGRDRWRRAEIGGERPSRR